MVELERWDEHRADRKDWSERKASQLVRMCQSCLFGLFESRPVISYDSQIAATGDNPTDMNKYRMSGSSALYDSTATDECLG